MKSKALSEWVEEIEAKVAEAVDRLDETASKIEAANLSSCDISIVERVAEKPRLFIRRDLTNDEKLNEVATDLLRRMAKLGFHLDAKPGEKPYSDYAPAGRREWKLTGDVLLACFVSWEEDAVCRYVKTGQALEDQYEIVCE